jgi:peptidoglycan/xylan/chitin deacetylase (PgdA/CDA1 family)
MKTKLFLFCTILLGFSFYGCKNAGKQHDNSNQDTITITETAVADVKSVVNSPEQILAKPEVPVLCYHRIEDGKKGDYTVSPATFSAHMRILADSGFQTISPAQLHDYLVHNATLPQKPVLITFDDSRVEHIEIAAPVMEKLGFKGVFFIMTITYNKKNYMTKDQIAELAKSGHTVGLHSWDHTMVTKYAEETDWQKQVIVPKEKLESIVGMEVDYWAYPNGVYDPKGAAELSKYFKLSFILTSKRDSIHPLQTVRRMIVPEWTAQGLLKSIKRTF